MKSRAILLLSFLFVFETIYAQQTVGLFLNDTASFNGYTLLNPVSSTDIYLIDNCGYNIHRWEGTGQSGMASYLLENGVLLRAERVPSIKFRAGGSGGKLLMLDQSSNVLWSYEYTPDTLYPHHDLEPLPNGNFLISLWETKTKEEVLAFGRDSNYVNENGLWPEVIQEVRPLGVDQIEVVWEWRLWDHLIQDMDSTKANFGVVAAHPELVDINFAKEPESGIDADGLDWLHMNSIAYNAELDQILLSSWKFNEIWVIDHSTTTEEAAGHTGGNSGRGGDLLYRYGNPQAYGRGTSDDLVFFRQHHAQWVPEPSKDAGKIMIFNNGGEFRDYSSVDIIAPPLNEEGTYDIDPVLPFGPTSLDWKYGDGEFADFFSVNVSGVQRLPNENTLICVGRAGRAFEIDSLGKVVWDYRSPVIFGGVATQGTNPNGEDLFRVIRYPVNYSGLPADLTPGLPIELEPLDYECTITQEVITSTNQTFDSDPILVYPNPFLESFQLELKGDTFKGVTSRGVTFQLIGIDGRLLQQGLIAQFPHTVSTESLPAGIYFLRLSSGNVLKLVKR